MLLFVDTSQADSKTISFVEPYTVRSVLARLLSLEAKNQHTNRRARITKQRYEHNMLNKDNNFNIASR